MLTDSRDVIRRLEADGFVGHLQAGRLEEGLSVSHFIALIHKDKDSGYGISFPDVPGIIAVADTLDQALVEAADVLAFAFEDWEGDKPSPRSLDELRQDPEFMTSSLDAVVAAVAPSAEIQHAA